MNGESRPKAAPDVVQAESTPDLRDDATTSAGPTWHLSARPLDSCHDHDEWAIDCPADCGAEALVWRSRPGDDRSGWGCSCGARGRLWQLLPGAVR